MATRAQIIAKAREYVGTPFVHLGRQKGVGIDCVGLVLCVAEDLGLVDSNGVLLLKTDYATYSPQPSGQGLVQRELVRRTKRKLANQFLPGDIVSLRVPIEPCHVGIITEYKGVPYIVHAYSGGERKCIEHIFNAQWQRRVSTVFEFPGLEE